MKSENPQNMAADWMNTIMAQNPLNNWIKTQSSPADTSVIGLLKEFGAEIDPHTFSRLQAEYFVELGKLWQDFLTSKTPEFKDRRFAASDWVRSSITTSGLTR